MSWNFWTSYTQSQISDITGFDQGLEFESSVEVKKYFNRESLISDCGEEEDWPDQEDLDQMAQTVINNSWHCKVCSHCSELIKDCSCEDRKETTNGSKKTKDRARSGSFNGIDE